MKNKHAPTMIKAVSPFLEGNFAPWRSEGHFSVLEVVGKIPDHVNGVLLRNGPNPQFDPTGQYHWFEGDGMLHAIRIQNGKVSYDNRWIRTERFKLENKAGKSLFNTNFTDKKHAKEIDKVSSNTANTHVIVHHEKILALNEGASAVEIALGNLETMGDYTFDDQIKRRLTAHPRFDYHKKEFMTYSYIGEDERLFYYLLDQENKLMVEKEIFWPYPAMMHDFVNTENYVIFPVFPCTMSIARMMRGEEKSQVEFAELLDCSKQHLCDVEHGRRFISPKLAAIYAKKVGYSESQFVRLCLQDMVNRDGLEMSIDVKAA